MLKLQQVLKDLKSDQISLIVDPQVIAGTSRSRPLTGMFNGAMVDGNSGNG